MNLLWEINRAKLLSVVFARIERAEINERFLATIDNYLNLRLTDEEDPGRSLRNKFALQQVKANDTNDRPPVGRIANPTAWAAPDTELVPSTLRHLYRQIRQTNLTSPSPMDYGRTFTGGQILPRTPQQTVGRRPHVGGGWLTQQVDSRHPHQSATNSSMSLHQGRPTNAAFKKYTSTFGTPTVIPGNQLANGPTNLFTAPSAIRSE